jgi:two-component system, LytTR family, sensor kinase
MRNWNKRWHPWAISAGALGIIALDRFAYRYLDVLSNGRHQSPIIVLVEEATSAAAAGLLLIPLLHYARWVRRAATSRVDLIARHGAVLPLFSVSHTTLNYLFRLAAFSALGLGHYDYGILPIRYWMEFPMDVIVYVVFVGTVYFLDHTREGREREVRLAQLEAELSRLRLRALEAQLQPHFLFNALNTISSVMYEDVRAADTMIAGLGELLRRSLRDDAPAECSLHEEMETLNLYLSIMRARFAERMNITIEIPDDTRDAAVPTLLLQPLVENALRHGDPGPGKRADVMVRSRRENGRLVLDVEDNGPGMSGSPHATSGCGVGLANSRRRLVQLYGADQRLSLNNRAAGGLTVRVEIPFRSVGPQ